MRLLLLLAAATALSGCAAVPPAADISLPRLDQLAGGFALEGRLSVKSAARNIHARLSWRHDPRGDVILLSTPFGQGLARLSGDSAGARLETADGQVVEATTPDRLSEQALGFPLPVGDGASWVLGRPGPEGKVLRADAAGRALEVTDRGWRIEVLEYENEGNAAPPRRLSLSRDDIEVRMVVDRWEAVQ